MTVTQAASELKVARKTVYAWIKNGLLCAGKLPGGSEIRIRQSDWNSFVASMFEEDIGAANDSVEEPDGAAEPYVEQPSARRRQPSDSSGRRDFFAIGTDIGHATSGTVISPAR